MTRKAISFLTGLMVGAFISVALFLILGCSLPSVTSSPNVHVVNSAWQVVREDHLARDITSTADIDADVAAYNATHTDDQWRIIYGDVPSPSEAPTADAYIVTADTHEAREEFHGIQRADLMERRAAWRAEVELAGLGGSPCVLYVDNVPPAPVAPAPVDPWTLYACYVVDSAGAVVFEEHPGAAEYARVARAYGLEVELYNATTSGDVWVFVTGRVYP